MDISQIEEKYKFVYSILSLNNTKIQKKFIKKLNEPISNNDVRGFIYGFRKKTDDTTLDKFWIKLGRTDRFNPMQRIIDEWNGIPIFVIETPYNHKLETLVHILFDYAHQIRYSEKEEREIEWFYFDKPTDVLGIISQLNILMNDRFNIKSIHILETENDDEIIAIKNKRLFCCFPLFYRSRKEKCVCNPVCCSYKTTCGKCEVGCCNCFPYCGVPNKNVMLGCCLV